MAKRLKEKVKSEVNEEVKQDIKDSHIPKPGDAIKIVSDSDANNRAESVPGINSGKMAKFSPGVK